jgi:hypothetical protein
MVLLPFVFLDSVNLQYCVIASAYNYFESFIKLKRTEMYHI